MICEFRLNWHFLTNSFWVGLSITVVAQDYETRVADEFVIKGNSAIMKCSIPSFAADFVNVKTWVSNKGDTYSHSQNYGSYLFHLFHLFFVFYILIYNVSGIKKASFDTWSG